jgi:cell division topological specificity factor
MSIQVQLNKILNYFRRPEDTARCAKERLQIIIAHERDERGKPDYLPLLQKDLLDVIAKYVKISKDDVRIELERQEGCSILELNIVLPSAQKEAI